MCGGGYVHASGKGSGGLSAGLQREQLHKSETVAYMREKGKPV